MTSIISDVDPFQRVHIVFSLFLFAKAPLLFFFKLKMSTSIISKFCLISLIFISKSMTAQASTTFVVGLTKISLSITKSFFFKQYQLCLNQTLVFYQEILVLFLGIQPSVIDSLPSQYSVSFTSFIVRVIVRGRPSRIATIMIVTAKAIRHDQVSCTSSSKL